MKKKDLFTVWEQPGLKAKNETKIEANLLKDYFQKITSIGPFYYYLIDFSNYQISNVSPQVSEIHDLEANTLTFSQIIELIHPEDLDFVQKAESRLIEIFKTTLEWTDLLKYKTSYCFRMKMKDGHYKMVNHQAIVVSLDEENGFGKSINIHTVVDHLTTVNNYQVSLFNLKDFNTFHTYDVFEKAFTNVQFTKREIQILKLISDGNSTKDIAEQLFISELTIKKHRANILKKAKVKTTNELVKNCVIKGII